MSRIVSSFVYLPDQYLVGMGVWLVALLVGVWQLVRLRRRWRQRPGRLRCVHAGLSVWVVLVGLTGIELYYAFLYDTTDSFNMTNVSKKWFAMHVEPQKRWLELGGGEGIPYRDDRDFPADVAAGQTHICFLGDSFTFAQGVADVSDRFSNRIRAELQRAHPGEFVVSNLADAGLDLHFIALQVERLFQAGYAIDTVVYVMCLNDIETFDERHRTYYNDFGARTRAPGFFLFRDTYFFNLMYFRLMRHTVPEVRDYYSFVKEYYAGEPWQRMSATLLEVQRICRANGADFRVAVFPFLHNLGPDYPFAEAHAQIVAFCREHEIAAVDLEPYLSPAREEGLTVNRFDAHPNERAHELAAEGMKEGLLGDYFGGEEERVE